MNIEEMIRRCSMHAEGVNPDTGKPYPLPKYEQIIPPPTIPEIMELMANGQPINSLQISSNLKFDDDGPEDGDDSTGYKKLEELIAKGYEEFDDPLMALDYAKEQLNNDETIVNPMSTQIVQSESQQETSTETGEETPTT